MGGNNCCNREIHSMGQIEETTKVIATPEKLECENDNVFLPIEDVCLLAGIFQ